MDEESDARNRVLHLAYERIPSYALWGEADIARETESTRLLWWKPFLSHRDAIVREMAQQWTDRLAIRGVPANESDPLTREVSERKVRSGEGAADCEGGGRSAHDATV